VAEQRLPNARISAGTPVEVHSTYTRRWTSGFEVVSVGEDGVRLRRVSDRSILPVAFRQGDVRVQYRSR